MIRILKDAWSKWLAFPSLMIGGTILVGLTLIAVIAPLVVTESSNEVNLVAKLQGPSWTYPLGTDHLGRSLLSRLLLGASTSITIAYAVMALSLAAGIAAGALAGWKGGWVDTLLVRICDLFLAVPSLVLGLAFIGIFGRSTTIIILSMVVVFWPPYMKTVRGLVLQLKGRTFLQAAQLYGTSDWQILWRHLLPNIVLELVVLASLDVGTIILFLSGLSFLGLGIEAPLVEWGAIINDSRPYWTSHPSLMVYPGIMILLTVVGFNRFGEALRDAFDIHTERAGRYRLFGKGELRQSYECEK